MPEPIREKRKKPLDNMTYLSPCGSELWQRLHVSGAKAVVNGPDNLCNRETLIEYADENETLRQIRAAALPLKAGLRKQNVLLVCWESVMQSTREI